MSTRRLYRRKFITVAGATAGAAVAFGAGGKLARAATGKTGSTPADVLALDPDPLDAEPRVADAVAPTPDAVEPAMPAPPASYLGLQPGQSLGRWTVTSVGPLRDGAVPVVLATEHDGEFLVDVVRRERGLDGIANTRQASLFLVNDGSGDTVSDEEQGCGALMLARHLEIYAQRGYILPAELLTYSQRRRAFPWRERR